jgi:hypothetical protein
MYLQFSGVNAFIVALSHFVFWIGNHQATPNWPCPGGSKSVGIFSDQTSLITSISPAPRFEAVSS